MRLLVLLLVVLFSVPYFAILSDRTVRLLKVLDENGVPNWGKRQNQEASLKCSIPKKNPEGQFTCVVFVGYPDGSLNSVYETLSPSKSKELSDLLIEFGVRPQGKRSIQTTDVRCRLPKGKGPRVKTCEMVSPYEQQLPTMN